MLPNRHCEGDSLKQSIEYKHSCMLRLARNDGSLNFDTTPFYILILIIVSKCFFLPSCTCYSRQSPESVITIFSYHSTWVGYSQHSY